MTFNTLLFAALAMAGAGATGLALHRYLTPAAKEARRRSRSHGSIVSSKRGPSIKLAVNTGERRKRKHRKSRR